ncbi:MAG: GGDEF domain-containing protein [Zoogloeaceae bacterium]|nr:GGDEF domain-containing protein [Zoogloeaceae bacterium]
MWLKRIFNASPEADIDALFALQRHVGEVHARTGVPVEFVARGARRFTTRIIVKYGEVLTQLLNRCFLDVILVQKNRLARTSGGHAYAVMMLDIDHFKRINDQYGHQAGDLVLQHAASLLLNAARDCTRQPRSAVMYAARQPQQGGSHKQQGGGLRYRSGRWAVVGERNQEARIRHRAQAGGQIDENPSGVGEIRTHRIAAITPRPCDEVCHQIEARA